MNCHEALRRKFFSTVQGTTDLEVKKAMEKSKNTDNTFGKIQNFFEKFVHCNHNGMFDCAFLYIFVVFCRAFRKKRRRKKLNNRKMVLDLLNSTYIYPGKIVVVYNQKLLC